MGPKKSYESGRRYNKAWEEKFEWLSKASDSSENAFCRLCRVTLAPKTSRLTDHEKGKKHLGLITSTACKLLTVTRTKRKVPDETRFSSPAVDHIRKIKKRTTGSSIKNSQNDVTEELSTTALMGMPRPCDMLPQTDQAMICQDDFQTENIAEEEEESIVHSEASPPSYSTTDFRPKSEDLGVRKLLVQSTQLKEGRFSTFGKYVGQELEGLPTEISIFAVKLINDVIYEAKLGNLSRESKLHVFSGTPVPGYSVSVLPPISSNSLNPETQHTSITVSSENT